MKFNSVFDVQEAFRKVLHAYSYPGDIVSLTDEIMKLETRLECFGATQILMYMLLDADTTFHIVSNQHTLEGQVAKITYCVKATLSRSQYIWVTKDEQARLSEIMANISCGTLSDPHLGATLIVECDRITSDDMLILKGPGIESEKGSSLKIEDDTWLDVRKECNDQYPMGLDMIFVDEDGNCIALPRTTQIVRNPAWHM